MKSGLHLLTEAFHDAITASFPQLDPTTIPIEVVQSTQEKFGHYQCNSAMKLGKQLQQPPRQIAEKLVAAMRASSLSFITDLEIAGPGFINITLSNDYLAKGIETVLNSPHLAIDLPTHPQKIVIDFSCPNIAKEMHVGHLRSTIIGDSLSRLFEFLGHDVLRLNHLGDWGTQFGMLIAYMKEYVSDVLTGKVETDLPHLMTWYRNAKKQFDLDADFKGRSQNEVVALQSGNPESMKIWHMICDISRAGYNQVYQLLDVKLVDRGESFYNPFLADVVADLERKGLVQESDGAKCVFLEGFQNRDGTPLPMIIQKSDGGYNYATTDLAAVRHRVEVEKADQILHVTDAGQSLHYQLVFAAARKAGYYDPHKVRLMHVPFGLVLGPDGKKFRTRSGETERLMDLLETAILEAKKILDVRSPEMDPSERETLARAIGIGSVKYADLSCHRTGDYTFSYERMLKFEGNTAAFLLYAYVRISGIKRKVQVDVETIKGSTKIKLDHPSEIALALHVLQFGEALELVSRDLLPNRLTDYLYGLAERFNAFFRDCRVEGSAEQNSRLLLCEVTARTLKQGLEILGLKTVERM